MKRKFHLKSCILFTSIALQLIATLATNSQTANPKNSPLKATVINPTNYKAAPFTEQAKGGKLLFSQSNCQSCHSAGSDGGCLGPPLAGVGAFRSKDYLLARLTNTKEAEKRFQSEYSYHAELMPHPRFAPATANKLVAYLLTLPMPNGGYRVQQHQPNTATKTNENSTFVKEASVSDIAEGARNFYKSGCAACHSIGNVGGSLAPALDDVGSRRDIDYITDHITDAQIHTRMTNPDYETNPSKMPHFKLMEKEIDQIAAFLYTLKSKKH